MLHYHALMHCHLLIPDLLPRRAITAGNDPLHGARAASLQTLLARGVRERTPATDMESWLCESFGAKRQQDYPVASLCLLSHGVKPESSYWLHADPVYLAVERDQLVLEQAPASPLSHAESEALIATLNQHFAVDGLHFLAPHPEHWYLRLDKPTAITTHNLHRALGQSIQPLLPAGLEAMRWRALLNEIQMLLFSHPVNEAREARGEAPVNSIWPWGGGVLPDHLQTMFDHAWANDLLAHGLALASGIPNHILPDGAENWLREARPGHHLLILDSLRTPACYGDPHDWRKQMTLLEQHWFTPMKQAVQRGAIKLTLYIPTPAGTLTFDVTRGSLWKLWQPVRPLNHYRPPEN